MDTDAWHMQHFCKTVEMVGGLGGLGGGGRHLALGCGFQAGAFVCPAAPREAGQNGTEQEKSGGNLQSHSRLSSTRVHPHPLPNTLLTVGFFDWNAAGQ